jgi:hypothetical protein
MKLQPHFCDSDEPLKEGFDIIANCGALVPNAEFVFLWNNDEFPEFLSVSMTRICRTCAQLELEKRYVYGIIAAQEILDATCDELEAVA